MGQLSIKHNAGASRFEVQVGEYTAVMEYVTEPAALRFTHTIVPPELGGQGVGSALVLEGLTYAKEQGLAVIPQCWFVAGYIERHPEWEGLLQAR